MMRILAPSLFISIALGCSSTTTVTFDAPKQVDAMGSAGACTGAVYDPCTTAAQCMSMNCKFYMQSNFTVCTQTCTPGDNASCPADSSGTNGVCNTMGLCKPAQPNNCTR